jgi:hypothetical protein
LTTIWTSRNEQRQDNQEDQEHQKAQAARMMPWTVWDGFALTLLVMAAVAAIWTSRFRTETWSDGSVEWPEDDAEAGEIDETLLYCASLPLAARLCAHKESLDRIRSLVLEWANKQDHDACWFYPEIFREIAAELQLNVRSKPMTLSITVFEEGCKKYRAEIFEPK